MAGALRDLGGAVARGCGAAHGLGQDAGAVGLDLYLGGLQGPVDRPPVVGVVEGATEALDDLELLGEGMVLPEPGIEIHARDGSREGGKTVGRCILGLRLPAGGPTVKGRAGRAWPRSGQ